jgi:pseudouridine synthase
MRLNKYIARAGIASRRAADSLILDGQVLVNGEIVRELGVRIDPEKDIVIVNGKKARLNDQKIYVALHKPPGYVTTRKDVHADKTVYDLLPKELRTILHPVGRLDKDSEGLLLLTNDGDFTYQLTHPKFKHIKSYKVEVRGTPTEKDIDLLRAGVELEDGRTAPAQIDVIGDSMFQVHIHEGKKRQIRRMFKKIGCPVIRLVRTGEAGLKLSELNVKPGEFKILDKESDLVESGF